MNFNFREVFIFKMLFRLFYSFFFVFYIFPISASAYVCLHPLEQAALFHGKSRSQSLPSRIKKARNNIENLNKQYEDKEEGIEEQIDKLASSFKEMENISSSKIAGVIGEYIEVKQDRWDQNWNDNKRAVWQNEEVNPQTEAPWFDSKVQNANKYFKRNGNINEKMFCRDFASIQRECERAIKRLKRLYEQLAQYQKQGEEAEEHLETLEEEEFDREHGLIDEEDETEASGLCFECLDELRELDKPTTGQVVGNALSVLAGGAISYLGYRAGRGSTRSLNDLRMRQGYDPVSSFGASWAGASLGLPFIANGIYGLAGGNSQFGNYACSPGFASGGAAYSPFGPYGAGANAGLRFGSPFGMPGFGANAGLQFGSPFGGMMPGMQAGMMPMANFQAQYQQQQYAQYLQFQQQQMQAKMQAQQAWLQHQMSVQKEWMQRQQVIGGLTQELYKIQQQIQLVASGGVGSSILGASSSSLSTGTNLGDNLAESNAPKHNPAPSFNNNPSGDLPVVEGQ